MMTRRYGLLAVIIISLLTFGACERINPEPDDTEQNEGNNDDNSGDDTDGSGNNDGSEDGGENGGSSDGNEDSGEGNEAGNGSEGGDNGDSGSDNGNDQGGNGDGGNDGQGGNGEGGDNGDGNQGDDYQWEAGTYFAPGVTKDSGWYDVNKKRDGMSDGDFLLCWAATAANLAQWWQDQYKAAGYTLPAGTPDGEGSYYELAVFEEAFKTGWPNQGCDINIGVHWYFTGEDRGVNMSGFPHPAQGSGGYFKDSFASIKAELGGDSYCEEILGYYKWGGGKSDSRSAIEIWSEYVKEHLKKGAMGMTIKPGFSSLHAVTLWGCDLDENGNVTAIYMTDSDDQMSTPNAPRVQILHHYNVDGSSGTVKIQGHFSGNVEITALTPLKQYPPTE